jgi:transketolase
LIKKKLIKESNSIKLDQRSKNLRKLILSCLEAGGRGHIGSAMSLVEILRVLYDNFLIYDSSNPKLKHRDRLILSKGHGCLALYALLADKKFFDKKELLNTCEHTSFLGGHPEFKKVPGVEASTGSLGHGMPIGVGMAISAKLKKEKHKIVVIVGDGEINEGSIWEAALIASKYKLNNLILVLDYNKIQSYGSVYEVMSMEPLKEKWESFGFDVKEVNGHNVNSLKNIFKKKFFKIKKPCLIICHTVKGKGLPIAENNPSWHHKNNLLKEEIIKLKNTLR